MPQPVHSLAAHSRQLVQGGGQSIAVFGDEVAAAWEQDAAKRELRVKECTYHFPLGPDEIATKLDQCTEERQCPKCLERFMVSSNDIRTRSPAVNP